MWFDGEPQRVAESQAVWFLDGDDELALALEAFVDPEPSWRHDEQVIRLTLHGDGGLSAEPGRLELSDLSAHVSGHSFGGSYSGVGEAGELRIDRVEDGVASGTVDLSFDVASAVLRMRGRFRTLGPDDEYTAYY